MNVMTVTRRTHESASPSSLIELHFSLRTKTRAIVGLIDSDIDKSLDFKNITAAPLKPGW
jgi:hypothetical protein